MSKKRGGLYVWRADKPHAVIGLPIIGRHFVYGGMTNSYYHREKQHLQGSVTYGTVSARWSDLRPKCYRILPLPSFILHGRYRRRITFALETLMIWLLCPVYNHTQQPPWNLRKISRAKAAAQRAARDELGGVAVLGRAFIRWVFWATCITLAVLIWGMNR